MLAILEALVDADDEDDLVELRGQRVQVRDDLLVVAVAGAGAVVAGQREAARRMTLVVVEDDVAVDDLESEVLQLAVGVSE